MGIQVPEAPETQFEVNEKLTIQYWGDDESICVWEAKVDKVTGYGAQVLLSILNGSVQSRKYHRFNFPLQVMLTIVKTKEKGLTGKQVLLETNDISAGGLLLETTLRLAVGDKLKLDIRPPPTRRSMPTAGSSDPTA